MDDEFAYMQHIGPHASDHQNLQGIRKGLKHGYKLLAQTWAIFAGVIAVDFLFVYLLRDIVPYINWIVFGIICLQALVVGQMTVLQLGLFARMKRMIRHFEEKR